MSTELYFSTDVETDGPIPGPHSMLSFGCAALGLDGEVRSTFSANLELLPGAAPDPRTDEFWRRNPDAYAETRKNVRPPDAAMREFVAWVDQTCGKDKPVFVAYPVTFDFMFVYWYMMRFAGRSPFSHSGLDTKTLAMVALRRPYRESVKRNMPSHWFPKQPHTHVALDDAIEQGQLFVNIMKQLRGASPSA